MPVTVNWSTQVIYVPQSYLTPLGGVFYELDIYQLKLDVGALLASQEGIVFEDAFIHNVPVVLSGITYDRFVEWIYSVEFESGSYVVNCTGANHNIADVKSADIPSLIVNNSAGRTIVTQDVPVPVPAPTPPVIILGGDVEVEVVEEEFALQVFDDHYAIVVDEAEKAVLVEESEKVVLAEEDEQAVEVTCSN